jgi:hypothetical protein
MHNAGDPVAAIRRKVLEECMTDYPIPAAATRDGWAIRKVPNVPPAMERWILNIYEQHSSRMVAESLSAAVFVGATATMAARTTTSRAYFFDPRGIAHEMPVLPWPYAGDEGNVMPLALTPHAWSLAEMMECEHNISCASLIQYGTDIIQKASDNPNLFLRLSDAQGRLGRLGLKYTWEGGAIEM